MTEYEKPRLLDAEQPELLPCPFCGSPAKVDSWWSNQDECGKAVVHCSMESYDKGWLCATIFVERVDEQTAREDAIAAWNRRADQC